MERIKFRFCVINMGVHLEGPGSIASSYGNLARWAPRFPQEVGRISWQSMSEPAAFRWGGKFQVQTQH